MRRSPTRPRCAPRLSPRTPRLPRAARSCGTRGRPSRPASSRTGRSISSRESSPIRRPPNATRPSPAHFFEPYSDSAGYRGLLQHPEADMRSWIGSADSAGLQVAVHAIGDRANAILLSIYDSVAGAHAPRDRRFRVEHAQHLRPQDIPLFAKLGVIASVQPYHAIDDGRWVEQRIGPVRIKTTYPFRTLLDTGGKLAFGSDWTVAPLDPILGVYAAVTRRTLDGQHPDGWVPEQQITVGEALRGYTAGNAYATFDEAKRGTLAPGGDADLVVLDRNLFTTPPDSLDQARVRYTIVGGRVVYRR